MKTFTTTALVLGLLISGATASPTKKPPVTKDKVLKTTTLKGKFVGFEVGDYVHARIIVGKGEEQTFYVGGPGLDFFLADNANKTGTFTIQTVLSNIPEAGGMIEIERVSAARFGKVNSKTWWTNLRKRKSFEAIEKEFFPKVQKLTR